MSKKSRRSAANATELRAMIDEAITDAYDEIEQVTGFYTMMADSLSTPFDTTG